MQAKEELTEEYPGERMSLIVAHTQNITLQGVTRALEPYVGNWSLGRTDSDYVRTDGQREVDGKRDPKVSRVRVESRRLVLGCLASDIEIFAPVFSAEHAEINRFHVVPFNVTDNHYPNESQDAKIVVYIPGDKQRGEDKYPPIPHSVVSARLTQIVRTFFGQETGITVNVPVDPKNGRLLDKHTGHGYIFRDPRSNSDEAEVLDGLVQLKILLSGYAFLWGGDVHTGKPDDKICTFTTSWYFKSTNPVRASKKEAAADAVGFEVQRKSRRFGKRVISEKDNAADSVPQAPVKLTTRKIKGSNMSWRDTVKNNIFGLLEPTEPEPTDDSTYVVGESVNLASEVMSDELTAEMETTSVQPKDAEEEVEVEQSVDQSVKE